MTIGAINLKRWKIMHQPISTTFYVKVVVASLISIYLHNQISLNFFFPYFFFFFFEIMLANFSFLSRSCRRVSSMFASEDVPPFEMFFASRSYEEAPWQLHIGIPGFDGKAPGFDGKSRETVYNISRKLDHEPPYSV